MDRKPDDNVHLVDIVPGGLGPPIVVMADADEVIIASDRVDRRAEAAEAAEEAMAEKAEAAEEAEKDDNDRREP